MGNRIDLNLADEPKENSGSFEQKVIHGFQEIEGQFEMIFGALKYYQDVINKLSLELSKTIVSNLALTRMICVDAKTVRRYEEEYQLADQFLHEMFLASHDVSTFESEDDSEEEQKE